VIEISPIEHILVLVMHHIASDGWSLPIFVKELVSLYGSREEGVPSDLMTLPIQYADYSLWQRSDSFSLLLSNKLSYWDKKLKGISPLNLPTDFSRPSTRSHQGGILGFTISGDLLNDVYKLSTATETTLFMVLLSVFKVLLYRYSGQEDISVGSPIANRGQSDVEPLIGFFVNTLVLRSSLIGATRFKDFLLDLRATTLEAYDHQEVSFEKIVDQLGADRDMSRSPLFDVMFVLQNNVSIPEISLGEAVLSSELYERDTTAFDLTFSVDETSSGLAVSIEYSKDLFLPDTIVRMFDHYKMLLSSVVSDPEQSIGNLSMLTPVEEKELIHDFNDTAVDYPFDRTIID
uniref:condensation domain-containing protein n=1 Tax=Aquimarina sp. I32.4 TaxID=2053903 RepID=UPI001E2B346E